MELRSFLDSPTSFRGVPISIFQRGSSKSSAFLSPFTKVGSCRNYPDARKLKNCHLRAQLSPGTKISISSSSVEPIPDSTPGEDGGVVFVAGATGRVGSRTVRELLKLGFRVRAGVRNVQRADPLVQSVKQIKFDTETAGEGSQPVERLEIVQCDLESPNQIGRALGNASVVICCIGASEKEVFDVTGPYRIDYVATKNLINAATIAKVDHFILVSSLGTNKVGFPAAILNLFWGVLIWKRKAEEALVASGIPYTIVRPGGMERPTDSFKETHNITIHEEDTKFGGLVSNLQIAELMAFMAKNQTLSYCKVVEVIAETTVPLRPFGEQLQKIPSQRSVPPEALDASSETVAVISESSLPDVMSSSAEKEPTKEEPVIKRPLSPYIAYEELKPPTSPIPIQPSSLKQKEDTGTAKPDPSAFETPVKALKPTAEEPVQVVKNQPLSPYTAYADLKPPSSPSPVAPTTTNKFEGTSGPSLSEVEAPAAPFLGNNNDAIKLEKSTNGAPESANGPPEALMNNLSPYPVYSDLKPPTSPSPSAPVSAPTEPEKAIDNISVDTPEPIQPENADDRVSTDIAESTQPEKTKDEPASSSEPKARPLSPYTMYADMKPPTTPTPSPKKEH